MKKLLVSLLIAGVALTGVACGTTQANNSTESTTTATVEETTTTVTTLYDADGIKITTEGFAEDDFWGMGFQLYLENNTDRHLCVSIEDASLDGYMITMIDILDTTSGMKDKEIAMFGDTESTEYKNFQGTLHVYDGDTYDTIMDIPFNYNAQ